MLSLRIFGYILVQWQRVPVQTFGERNGRCVYIIGQRVEVGHCLGRRQLVNLYVLLLLQAANMMPQLRKLER